MTVPFSRCRALALSLAAFTLAMTLGGCEQIMRNMYEQPKLDPGESSPLFPDQHASRPPPEGSIAHAKGDLAATSSGRRGTDEVDEAASAAQRTELPRPLPRALLLRGEQRFTVYCQPCHSPLGDGDGPVVRRGFPAPPSYHSDRLREAPDRHFYDVISDGYGIMHSYSDRVTPSDRWAIVGYIRALQLSQHAQGADLPPELRSSSTAPTKTSTQAQQPQPQSQRPSPPATAAPTSGSPAEAPR